MDTLLNTLQQLSADLANEYNSEVLQFNELMDQLDESNKKVYELEEVALAHDKLVKHQKSELDRLLKLHNNSITEANAGIRELNGQITNQEAELKKLRAMNPERLNKQNKNLQAKNKELQDANDALKKKNSEANKTVKDYKRKINEMNKPVWQSGRESIMAYHEANIVFDGDIYNIGAWWRFDGGLQLLCVYDQENDAIIKADVAPVEHIPQPSMAAEEFMKQMLKEASKKK